MENLNTNLWWRRRESNPRPKSLSARRVHALSDSEGFAAGTQNGQDAPEASPIDLTLAARTEPLTPACCATPCTSPQAKPERTAT
jgi:hypothetical protein